MQHLAGIHGYGPAFIPKQEKRKLIIITSISILIFPKVRRVMVMAHLTARKLDLFSSISTHPVNKLPIQISRYRKQWLLIGPILPSMVILMVKEFLNGRLLVMPIR